MSSSGSTRSGDKSDPHSLGSGDKENFENRLEWVELGKSSFKVLTLSERVLSRDAAASEYGDSEIVC